MREQVQFYLGDTCQSLLLEITALRAKIAEMREQSLTQERDIRSVLSHTCLFRVCFSVTYVFVCRPGNRDRVREEYDSLVHNIFAAAFDIKKRYDEFRCAS